MATVVYSTNFQSFEGLVGDAQHAAVPVDFVYVVKQLTVYMDSGGGTIRARFKNFTSGATLFAAASETDAAQLPVPTWAGFYGTLVFLPGEIFGWEVQADPVSGRGADVSTNGFEFQNPPA
jgi:hypothetical protein